MTFQLAPIKLVKKELLRDDKDLGFTHEVQRGLGTRKYLERCFVSESFAWSSIEEPFDFFKFSIGYG